MRIYLKFSILLIIVAQALPFGLYSQNSGFSREVENRLNEVENNLISWVKLDGEKNWNIYDRMAQNNVYGLSITVIDDYRIDWSKGYGIADTISKSPVTPETLFQTASIGKSLNSLAFMKLAQENQIDLTRDINEYLKRWQFPYDSISEGKVITLNSILSHTAGLSVGGFDGYLPGDELPNLNQIIDGLAPANNAPVRSEIEPNSKFQYSGGGYEVSEILLEDVTGLSYTDYITRMIFNPLKMESSSYAIPTPDPTRTASGYRYDKVSIGAQFHAYPEKACGAGLWSTSTDIARFVIDVQKSLKDDSGKIISQVMARKMTTPIMDNAALGVFVEEKGGIKYFQHTGLNEGFSSIYIGSIEKGDGVVVLSNSDYTDFLYEIVNSVATVYKWEDFYPFAPKTVVAPPKEVLKRYLGAYYFENNHSGPEIQMDDQGLFMMAPGSPTKWRMYFTTEKDFFMLEAKWVNQRFYFDEAGDVLGFDIIGDDSSFKVLKRK